MKRYFIAASLAAAFFIFASNNSAQEPTMMVPNLGVRTVTSGLVTPISIAFPAANEVFVLEKNTGQVKRIVNGAVQSTVLDLAVNNASERGLLGIALHPNFPADPSVFLFWSCKASVPPSGDPFFPEEQECSDAAMFGADSANILEVPLLGNRVDRFTWNGTSLVYQSNLIKLLSFQNDAAPIPPGQGDEDQPARGNHDGGVLAFGPDGKLYIMFGDAGRRGQLQNLISGPTPPTDDDQFGGPEPDNPHFTGVILRLNPDGTAPADNPFFDFGGTLGGEVGANIQKVYAYGVRNSFGMAFDPVSGSLWDQENGEDAYDEINLIEAGMNSGWIQIIGPSSRVADFRGIEMTSLHHEDFPNLQQFRWGPERIAMTEAEALSRLFVLPGSQYKDPAFSWRYVLAPAAIGFLRGKALGPQYQNDLFVGFSTTDTLGGPLFRFNLTGNRRAIGVDDPRLADRVADNLTFHDISESESLVIGADFGIVTDIKTAPNGRLYVVSLDRGSIFEVFSARERNGRPLFANMTGEQEVPGPGDPDGTGTASIWLNHGQARVCYNLTASDIEPAAAAHIHRGVVGVAGPVVIPLEPPTGGASSDCVSADAGLILEILQHPERFYVNVHNAPFPNGAIRGQLRRGHLSD
jgi:aldose sugar dehydrogenase